MTDNNIYSRIEYIPALRRFAFQIARKQFSETFSTLEEAIAARDAFLSARQVTRDPDLDADRRMATAGMVAAR